LGDYELIAQELESLEERFGPLENRVTDLLMRMTDVEKVNARLEQAALTTARAMQEIAGHWDAVYEAMRRTETAAMDQLSDEFKGRSIPSQRKP